MRVHLDGRRLRGAALIAAVSTAGAVGLSAPPAWATASSATAAVTTSNPEQAIPVDLSISGTNATTQDAVVDAVVRPAGGLACQSSYEDDNAALGSENTALSGGGGRDVSSGAYSVALSFKPPSAGSYQVCAWLEQSQSGDQVPIAGPATVTFSARGPQVGQLTVTLPATAAPDTTFRATYTTQTDQQLSLYSVIKPAAVAVSGKTAPATCASSFDTDQGQRASGETTLLGYGSATVFGGPTTTGANINRAAGSYLLCTWLEGPVDGEVDAAASTPLTLGTPATPAKPGLRIRTGTASRRHGVSIAGTTAARFTGRVRMSAACGRSTSTRTVTSSHGRFSGQLPLPRACRSARTAKLSVVWGGSKAFARQTVSRTVAIKR